jgi:hypothetical protein
MRNSKKPSVRTEPRVAANAKGERIELWENENLCGHIKLVLDGKIK